MAPVQNEIYRRQEVLIEAVRRYHDAYKDRAFNRGSLDLELAARNNVFERLKDLDEVLNDA